MNEVVITYGKDEEGRAGWIVVYIGTGPETGIGGRWPYFYDDLSDAVEKILEWCTAKAVAVEVERLLGGGLGGPQV